MARFHIAKDGPPFRYLFRFQKRRLYVIRYSHQTTNSLHLPDKYIVRKVNAARCFLPCSCLGQRDTDFIYKEPRYILSHIPKCLISAFSGQPIATNMTIALKLYVIASRGFVARLNSIDKNKRPSATQERESIRRDMTEICKEAGDFAPMPASLFDCLTELCRSIDKGEIDVPNLRNEAGWNKIVDYLVLQRKPGVNFNSYRDTICQFLWSYLEPQPTVPTRSAQASTSTITTAQTSHAPSASAPMPEPSHAEFSTAPTPGRKITPLPLLEDSMS